MVKLKVINALGIAVKFIAYGGFVSLEITPFKDGWFELFINTGEPESSGNFFSREAPEVILDKIERGEVITVRAYKDLMQEYREKAIRDAQRGN